jgi:SAM-dependent methyltransferase
MEPILQAWMTEAVRVEPSAKTLRGRAESAIPYSALAHRYDQLLGRRFFDGLRCAFEEIVRRYGLRFCSAVDLGCGTGLFACWLSQRYGIPVLAVDRSPAMLAAAFANCRDCRVGFLQQDIRKLELPCRVDLATANFDTLNHLLDERDFRRTLARVFDNLAPGGHFVFDLLTDRQRAGRRRIAVGSPSWQSVRLWQHVRWSPRSGILTTTVALLNEAPDGLRIERHIERGYDAIRVARWLEGAGFKIRALLDAPTLAYAHATSLRVLFVARKNGAVQAPKTRDLPRAY